MRADIRFIEPRWNYCAGFGLEPINAIAREAADALLN